MNGCCNLSEAFCASNKIIMSLLPLNFFSVVKYISWFMFVELSLHLWDKANHIMVNDLLMCSRILFACILRIILQLRPSENLAYYFFFVVAHFWF